MDSGQIFQNVPLGTIDGVIRVSGTRVTLDTLVAAFEIGSTPEEIVQPFPTLGLANVTAVITDYLRHRDEWAPTLRSGRSPRIGFAAKSRASPM